MRIFRTVSMIFATILLSFNANAQSDLQVFGFFQGVVNLQMHETNYSDELIDVSNVLFSQQLMEEPMKNTKHDLTSLDLQQANLMAMKDFGKGFGMFLNLEFVNNYSSQQGWGYLNLQEAYMTYSGEYINIKAGMFLPQFNNLNEISNRTPLLPYIVRPYAYEAAYSELIAPDAVIPPRALAQIYGNIPVGSSNIDYAVWLGKPKNSYIFSSDDNGRELDVTGQSTNSFMSVGSRIGFRNDWLKIGASINMDQDDKRQFNVAVAGENMKSFGNIPRMLLGFDLKLEKAGFTLMGEYIIAQHTLTDAQTDSLKAWADVPKADPGNGLMMPIDLSVGALGDSFDRSFMYALLQYNFTSDLYAYAMYNVYTDKGTNILADEGVVGIGGGIGYQLIDEIILKAQFQNTTVNAQWADYDIEMKVNQVLAGVSVMF